jgi:hypothetical protein
LYAHSMPFSKMKKLTHIWAFDFTKAVKFIM